MNKKESESSANEDVFWTGDGPSKKKDTMHRGSPTKSKSSRPLSSTGTSSQSSSPGASSTETLPGASTATPSNITADSSYENCGANYAEDLQSGPEPTIRNRSADTATEQDDDRQRYKSLWDLPWSSIQWREVTKSKDAESSQSKGMGNTTSLPSLYPSDSVQATRPTNVQQRTSIQQCQHEKRTEQKYDSAQASQPHGCIGDGRPVEKNSRPQNPLHTHEKPKSNITKQQASPDKRPSRDAQQGTSNILLPSLQNRSNTTDQLINSHTFPPVQFSEHPRQNNEGARPKEYARRRKYSSTRQEENRLTSDSSSQNASHMNRCDAVENCSPISGGARPKENFSSVSRQLPTDRRLGSDNQSDVCMQSPNETSRTSQYSCTNGARTKTYLRYSQNPDNQGMRQVPRNASAGPENFRQRNVNDRPRTLPSIFGEQVPYLTTVRQGRHLNIAHNTQNVIQSHPRASDNNRSIPSFPPPQRYCGGTGGNECFQNSMGEYAHCAPEPPRHPRQERMLSQDPFKLPCLENRTHESRVQSPPPSRMTSQFSPMQFRQTIPYHQGFRQPVQQNSPSFQHIVPRRQHNVSPLQPNQHNEALFQHNTPPFQNNEAQYRNNEVPFEHLSGPFQTSGQPFQRPPSQLVGSPLECIPSQFQTVPPHEFEASHGPSAPLECIPPQFQNVPSHEFEVSNGPSAPPFYNTVPLECIPPQFQNAPSYGFGVSNPPSAPPYQNTVTPLRFVAHQFDQDVLGRAIAEAPAGSVLSQLNDFPSHTFFPVREFAATMLRSMWSLLQGREAAPDDSSEIETDAQNHSPEAQAEDSIVEIARMQISFRQHFTPPRFVPTARIMTANYLPNENPLSMDTIFLHIALKDLNRYPKTRTINARVMSAFRNELDNMFVVLIHSARSTTLEGPLVICADISPKRAPGLRQNYGRTERVMLIIKYPRSLESLRFAALRQSIQFRDWSNIRYTMDRDGGAVVEILSKLVTQDNKTEDVRTLLTAGTSTNDVTSHSTSLIMRSSCVGVTEVLLDYSATVNMEYEVDIDSGRTPLLKAARCRDEKTFRLLLSKNANAHQANARGYTPLMFAVMHGMSSQTLRLLLDTGVDVNAQNELGDTALHLAMHRKGRRSTLRLLFSKGAIVNITNNSGITPLMRAAESMSIRSIRLLIRRGADVNFVDEFNANALMFAIASRNRVGSLCDIMSLLGNSLTVNIVTDTKTTPLMLSAERRITCQRLAMRLIELGADPNIVTGTDMWRRTALSVAFHQFRHNTFSQGAMAHLLYLLYITNEMPILANFRPLIHFLMMKCSCHAVRYAIEKGAVPLEVPIQELENLIGTSFMHSCHRETISPLFLAVYIGSEILVKYFIHLRFYTVSDFQTFTNDTCFERKVKQLRHSRYFYMVRRALSGPRGGLEAMALTTLSHNIGGGPDRLRNIESLQLPWLFNVYLMYLLPLNLLHKETEEGEPNLTGTLLFDNGDYHKLRFSTIHPVLNCHCQFQHYRQAEVIEAMIEAVEAIRQHDERGPLYWPPLDKTSVRFDEDSESEATNDSASDANDRSSDEEVVVGYENIEFVRYGVRKGNSAACAQIGNIDAIRESCVNARGPIIDKNDAESKEYDYSDNPGGVNYTDRGRREQDKKYAIAEESAFNVSVEIDNTRRASNVANDRGKNNTMNVDFKLGGRGNRRPIDQASSADGLSNNPKVSAGHLSMEQNKGAMSEQLLSLVQGNNSGTEDALGRRTWSSLTLFEKIQAMNRKKEDNQSSSDESGNSSDVESAEDA